MLCFEQKVAVVTGATGTFGSEFCRTFAEHGADLVLACRSKEKGEAQSSIMGDLPPYMPALMQAEKVQEKARRVGFDWDTMEPAMEKVYEELDEFKEALINGDNPADELGDILFSVVNVARFANIDAEKALLGTVRKFILRFQYLEAKARLDKRQLSEYTIDELDAWWEEAKYTERSRS